MVDTETGVNYIMSCGMNGEITVTPLLGADGKLVVDDVSEYKE